MKKTKKLFIILFLGLLTISGCSSEQPQKKTETMDNATEHIFSHRGASGEETEHTLDAYDLAIKYGSVNIEQDIVTSKNGTFWISHDLSAKNMFGVDKLFKNMTDAEISKLRTKDNYPVLKMQDVFTKYGKTINYVIELKNGNAQTEDFIKIVQKNDIADNIIVQDKNIESLNKLEQVFPNMQKLYLVTLQEQLDKVVSYENVDIVSAYAPRLFTKENVDLVHKHNKKINFWTIDKISDIKKAIEIGSDSYFTNYTAKAFVLEREFRK